MGKYIWCILDLKSVLNENHCITNHNFYQSKLLLSTTNTEQYESLEPPSKFKIKNMLFGIPIGYSKYPIQNSKYACGILNRVFGIGWRFQAFVEEAYLIQMLKWVFHPYSFGPERLLSVYRFVKVGKRYPNRPSTWKFVNG